MPNNAYMSGARLGRKPFLGLVMVGKLAGAAFNLLNAVYLDTWSRWVGLLYTCTPAHLYCTPEHLGQVGVAGHRDAGPEFLRGLPRLHHDDLQLHSGQLHAEVGIVAGAGLLV